MPAAGAAMAAFTEYPDMINKIAFFQVVLFLQANANIPCHQPLIISYEVYFPFNGFTIAESEMW